MRQENPWGRSRGPARGALLRTRSSDTANPATGVPIEERQSGHQQARLDSTLWPLLASAAPGCHRKPARATNVSGQCRHNWRSTRWHAGLPCRKRARPRRDPGSAKRDSLRSRGRNRDAASRPARKQTPAVHRFPIAECSHRPSAEATLAPTQRSPTPDGPEALRCLQPRWPMGSGPLPLREAAALRRAPVA